MRGLRGATPAAVLTAIIVVILVALAPSLGVLLPSAATHVFVITAAAAAAITTAAAAAALLVTLLGARFAALAPDFGHVLTILAHSFTARPCRFFALPVSVLIVTIGHYSTPFVYGSASVLIKRCTQLGTSPLTAVAK